MTLFDGKSLQGWRGNAAWWSVVDGAIASKSQRKVPTSFLFTDARFSDFRLTLLSRMTESDNHAGVCFWSEITDWPERDNKWYTHGPLVIVPKQGMWDYSEATGLRVFRPTTGGVTSQHEWVRRRDSGARQSGAAAVNGF